MAMAKSIPPCTAIFSPFALQKGIFPQNVFSVHRLKILGVYTFVLAFARTIRRNWSACSVLCVYHHYPPYIYLCWGIGLLCIWKHGQTKRQPEPANAINTAMFVTAGYCFGSATPCVAISDTQTNSARTLPEIDNARHLETDGVMCAVLCSQVFGLGWDGTDGSGLDCLANIGASALAECG